MVGKKKPESRTVFSPGQATELGSALMQGIPPDLSTEDAQYWIGRKPKLHTALETLLKRKAVLDPNSYHAIKGLTVIGPVEIERAFLGPNGENPLELESGWCPRIPIPLSVKEVRKRVKLAKEWNTSVTLFLDLSEVAGQPTSLENQYNWFGVAHDNLGPGIIRDNVFWSNWFMDKSYSWALGSSVQKPVWKIKYELPRWTCSLNWNDQKRVVADHKLTITTVTSDILYLNLIWALTSKRLRGNTCARTATIYHRCPLFVCSYDVGVYVYDSWYPEGVYADLGAAVEEVLVLDL